MTTSAKRPKKREAASRRRFAPGEMPPWLRRLLLALQWSGKSGRSVSNAVSPGSPGLISHWSTGYVREPSINAVLEACRILGVNPVWVINGGPDEEAFSMAPRLPSELERVLKSGSQPSQFVYRSLLAFAGGNIRVDTASLSEEGWRQIRVEMEQAEARSTNIVDLAERIRTLEALRERAEKTRPAASLGKRKDAE